MKGCLLSDVRVSGGFGIQEGDSLSCDYSLVLNSMTGFYEATAESNFHMPGE